MKSKDPYMNLLKDVVPDHEKTACFFRVICVLSNMLKDRNLKIIHVPSRAIYEKNVIEIIATDIHCINSKIIKDVSYLCFAECLNTGILFKGDRISLENKFKGIIIGFNEDHSPNHLNVVVGIEKEKTGKCLKVELGDKILVSETKFKN